MNRKHLTIGILTFLFIFLILLIKTDMINGFDTQIYSLITANMSPDLTQFFKSLTFLGEGKTIAAFCVFFLILFYILKEKEIGFIIAGCVIINSFISEFLKMIIARPRPDVLRLVTENSYSFPSSHTLASITLWGILLYLIFKSNINTKVNEKIKWIFLIILTVFLILIPVSRIYLGAHHTSDVIGGAVLAILLLLIETEIIEKKEWI